MASSVNKIILIGRVGQQPTTQTLDNGSAASSFSLATSETFKDRTTGEKKEVVEWHQVVAWRGLSDIVSKYVNQGDLLYIEGKLKTRTYEKDNVTRSVTEIIADSMTMLGKGKPKPAPQAAPAIESSGHVGRGSTDDLPF